MKDVRKFAQSQGRGKEWTALLKLKRPDGSSLVEVIGSDVFVKPNWDGEEAMNNQADLSWSFIQGYYYPKFSRL